MEEKTKGVSKEKKKTQINESKPERQTTADP